MELEGLLNGNNILIYFVGIMYILINENFEKKQKIIIVYISTYILRVFNIMDLKIMIVVLNVVAFLYIGFLTKDDLKNTLLCSIWDKIKDYLYKSIFEYSALYFLISLIFISDFMHKYFKILIFGEIAIEPIGITLNVISLILLRLALTNVASLKYETNSFKEIKNKMDDIILWSNLKKENIDIEKMNMLVDIEDKSYFIREKSYNFVSTEFIKYKLTKIYNKALYKINYTPKRKYKINFKNIKKLLFKKLYLSKYLKNMTRYIRGYSTIEMQIIRTLGVKNGYDQVICRKIYEILYSKMFFKNLRKNMNRVHLNTAGCSTYKEYLLYIYINIANIKIINTKNEEKNYKNMLEPWKKDFKEVSKEEFFISILGLSHRKISNNIMKNYDIIVEWYKLNKEKLRGLIKSINKE